MMLRLATVAAASLLLAAAATNAGAIEGNVDVAPFGYPLHEANGLGVRWPEARRVTRIEVAFADGASLPAPDAVTVEYWQHTWNGAAVDGADSGTWAGWGAADDWFTGQWKMADTRLQVTGRAFVLTFAPSGEKEFPDLKGRGVTYRPTLKVRVSLPAVRPQVSEFRVFTDSMWRTSAIRIQFEGRSECDDPLESYNGRVMAKQAVAAPGGCEVHATVAYALNPYDAEADRTILTVRSPQNPFSFAVDEAERGDRIYVKDFGALVTRAADPITIAEYRNILAASGAQTIYDRVAQHPEQTLSAAWSDMPLKVPYYFILGCEGGRQRFRLDPNGDISMRVPAPDLDPKISDKELLWRTKGSTEAPSLDNLPVPHFKYSFGLPKGRFADRTIAEGYLPMVTTRWLAGDLLYEQEGFADVLAGNLNTGPPMQADDPTVAMVKIRIKNTGAAAQNARLTLSSESLDEHANPVPQDLHVRGEMVMGEFEGREILRYLVDTRGAGQLSNSGDEALYQVQLQPGHEHTIFFKIPFVTLTSAHDIGRLRTLSPERERSEVQQYWEKRVAAGAEIRTPELWLNEYYKAHKAHLLINDEREIGSDRYVARVGSQGYGAFGNESTMMISELDRLGYSKEAERSYELFLHYQGTVALPGTFRRQKGELYGAGGYEMGGYNQHHGWILWGLAEHYWYTRDRAWMERAAPHLVEACRWVIDERKATQLLDDQGRRVAEYGLLPAGSLEDITDYWYWVSTNSFTWWGLANAAAALKDFGHPEGAQLAAEAEKYRQDILAAYRGAMVRSPVVRLRDGTYVPHVPSNVYTRGRAQGWIRETLEGAIMLPITRLLDPNSREAQWILKDYEDNRYISDRYGYSVPVFDNFWFSRGGFSKQPNLLHGPLPYFYRDEIKLFLRAYFNPFAAGYDPTLRILPEHPLPELGCLAGELFKTSDESQSAYWLRLMFVTELDGNLHLGRGIPRYWLRDGETIGISNASTYFGKLSYEIRSQAKAGRISMTLEPPVRNPPRQIIVRFRHPEEKPIRSVTVNGATWSDFDPAQGDIRLPGAMPGKVEVVVSY
jgi:hypothetical protein